MRQLPPCEGLSKAGVLLTQQANGLTQPLTLRAGWGQKFVLACGKLMLQAEDFGAEGFVVA
jgi:hypothetical protein